MGCNTRWHIIYLIFSIIMLSLFLEIQGLHQHYDPHALDALLRDHAREALVEIRTGKILNVSLPANFSGIEARVIRLRTGNLWDKGVNFSSLYIPPRVIPLPFVKRMFLVYQDLGNWSTHYYGVTGYNLVSPVVGFRAYDASNSKALGNKTLRISAMSAPILVRFPRIYTEDKDSLKCVKLGPHGLIQFRNMTEDNVCMTQGDGHFTIVAPTNEAEKKKKIWKLWVVGIAGALALVLLGVILYTICKLARSKRTRKMEGESENGVTLETTWIATSKMPSASMVRTQPALEQGYVP